jgi:hypothetical protein
MFYVFSTQVKKIKNVRDNISMKPEITSGLITQTFKFADEWGE